MVLKKLFATDWVLVAPILMLMLVGLITNFPIEGFSFDSLFFRQVLFALAGVAILLSGSSYRYAILKGPFVSLLLFLLGVGVLTALLIFAPKINGAQSWFIIGPIALQPVEFIKIILIIVLARYFATRHINIRHVRHVLVSLAISAIFFFLVFQQPDLGSSVTLISIWAGMLFVSGVSKKHIIGLLAIALAATAISWQFIPQYQQERIVTFLTPLENLQSSGYTAYQSKIAIGSGEMFGKGIGEGTQSNLGFLPLHESDFVFAAFAEEWGFVGVVILLLLYGTVCWRLLVHAMRGRTNFETLYTVGVFMFIFSHMFIHIGVNVGILPVTGITLPFMSYGGSHILAEALAIALVLSMAQSQLPSRFDEMYQRQKRRS